MISLKNKKKLKVGISSCLLGEKVRFDGQHKRDELLLSLLGTHVRWVAVCPEVESGMSIPREPIRLVKRSGKVRVVTVKTEQDVTQKLSRFCLSRVRQLAEVDLDGFILKKGSPSCGMERVKCYGKGNIPTANEQGVFARALQEALPNLPVEEEGRLKDAGLRENFIERIFAYRRVKELFAKGWKLATVVQFHSQHKFQILAHSPQDYRQLGQLVAKAKQFTRSHFALEYSSLFMRALSKKATVGRNTNALEHMAGFLKDQLAPDDKSELNRLIKEYHSGWIPLVVPVTLLGHHVRRCEVEYLRGQSYLEPNPRELMLRNHV